MRGKLKATLTENIMKAPTIKIKPNMAKKPGVLLALMKAPQPIQSDDPKLISVWQNGQLF